MTDQQSTDGVNMTDHSGNFKTFPKNAQWFRVYHEMLDDPKVQRLNPHTFKAWINLLCLAARNGGMLPTITDIAFALRISDLDAQNLIDDLIDIALIDILPDKHLRPHNWDRRQFITDTTDPTNTERQRRWRNRQKKIKRVTRNVTPSVTQPVKSSVSVSVSGSVPHSNILSSQEGKTLSVDSNTRDGGDA